MTDVELDSDWPSHREELTRLTINTVERYTKMYEGKKITKREFFLVISSLYDTTAGLINTEFRDLMAEIHKELIS